MKFGAVAPGDALGATAVHSIRRGTLVLKKGTLIGLAEIAALEAAGIPDLIVARLEPGDVSEDVAAAAIAKQVAGEGVHVDRAFTGRANLFAKSSGVLVIDKDAVDRLNRIEESRRRTSESIRRLLGIDMPIKVDATVTDTTQQDLELQEMLRDAKARVQLEEQKIVDGGD